MEITVPLVVGGLAGLSVATACGVEPRVPQVPPAELARQALETVAEKLPRELMENDLLKKIARSWASLAPAQTQQRRRMRHSGNDRRLAATARTRNGADDRCPTRRNRSVRRQRGG